MKMESSTWFGQYHMASCTVWCTVRPPGSVSSSWRERVRRWSSENGVSHIGQHGRGGRKPTCSIVAIRSAIDMPCNV